MINALTIDVEDYFHVAALSSRIDRRAWDSFHSRVEANTNRLLDILDQHRVKATFFVLGWVAERFSTLVRGIAIRGHEIACHGLSHQLIYNQTIAEFRQETVRAKSVLEDIVQKPVFGYRAASYSITKRSMWALDILVELGFSYDSSIFPVRHDLYGIPRSRREPYVVRTANGSSIIEFPLSTIELFSYRLPVSGGGYFRLFPYAITKKALKTINEKEGRPFIFYLHPWEIDPAQPRFQVPWLSQFRHYHNLEKTEARLNRLLSDFEFGTVQEVLQGLELLEEKAVATTND